MPSLIELLRSGGLTMYPLFLCSLLVWAVIFERIWRYRKLGGDLREFHLEVSNALIRQDMAKLKSLCARRADVPTAQILQAALERLSSKEERLRRNWPDAMERKRQLVNLDLRKYLWVLGTIASSAPFIGLGGTVVGVLRSFHEMAKSGAGGFTVVAGGISEALVATAVGIVVAVVSVLAYNTFQTTWSSFVLTIKLQTEELVEMLSAFEATAENGSGG